MPALASKKASTNSHFKVLTSFKTDYSPIEITKYESQRTGMSVVVVQREGPMVSGFFTLATEIFDDSGAPHTLEHLVFRGSKNYRYGGLLDKIATRAYSHTNAWTATDHTAYTIETAGWNGFAQILPIYLEHIISPTLTDDACYTEVYHIDGTGHDAGVVYCEMQARQNDQNTLMFLEATRLMYPKDSGYCSKTGGQVEDLRILTNKRIRDFHKEMYQPKNLCVVIIGDVVEEELLSVLDKFEESIIPDVPKIGDPWRRPWIDSKPVQTIKENVVQWVDFPEKDESMGEVLVSFLGPDCMDYTARTALDVLDSYLAGSSVSVLEKNLVEIPDPFTSGVIFDASEPRSNTEIWIQLTSVPTKKLEAAEKELFNVLNRTVNEPLDMEYLKDCLKRTKRLHLNYVESSGSRFTTPVLCDFIYGKRDGSELNKLENLNDFAELENWSESDWQGFLKRWLIDNKHISILGKPSAKLADKVEADEKARVEEQIKKIGPEGLKKLEDRLEEAKKANEPDIPREMLKEITIPPVESLKFIKSTTAQGGTAISKSKTSNKVQDIISKDGGDKSPLFFHFEHVPSNFVSINLLLTTENIPVELRKLLPVFEDNFFDTPVKLSDGTTITYEKLVTLLEKDTVYYDMYSGGFSGNKETLRIRISVEPERYQAIITRLKDIIWGVVFDPERLLVHVKKALSDIPEQKRDGSDMSYAVLYTLLYAPESIGYGENLLVKNKYLRRYRKMLKSNPEQAISQMKELRDALFKLENVRILVIGDLEKLQNPVSSWDEFMAGRIPTGKLAPLDQRTARLTDAAKKPGNLAYVVPIPSIDSSFLVATSKGPSDVRDPDIPALILACAYLDAAEGPLWKAVRGTGLAYSYGLRRHTDSGLFSFNIYRSPDAWNAFAKSKEVIAEYADGTKPFDDLDLEGAISQVVVSVANAESTMQTAGVSSFVNQVIFELPKDWNMQLLKKVRAVTIDDLKAVIKKIILPVFEPETSIVSVTCASVQADSLKEKFANGGFPVEVKDLESFEPKYDGEGEDDDEEDSEDGSDEEDDEDDSESDGGDDDKAKS